LSRLSYPAFPEPMGVLRDVQRPTYESLLIAQNDDVLKRKGPGNLAKLFASDDCWTVERK